MLLTVFTSNELKNYKSYLELLKPFRNTYENYTFRNKCLKMFTLKLNSILLLFLNVKPHFANRIAISTLGDEATFMPKHASPPLPPPPPPPPPPLPPFPLPPHFSSFLPVIKSEWSGKASRDRAKPRDEDGDDDDDRAKPRVGAFCFLLAES